MFAVFDGDLAVDHGEVVADAALHPSTGALGEVVGELGHRKRHRLEVEHVEIGRRALDQDAAVGDAEQPCGYRTSAGRCPPRVSRARGRAPSATGTRSADWHP